MSDRSPAAIVVVAEDRTGAVTAPRWGRLAEQVLDAEGVGGSAELSLHFVDESEIASLNEAHMGAEGPTDVLAFPLDPDDDGFSGGAPRLLGDVVIAPAIAGRQAADAGRDIDDELALLVVHGILHVLGMDHADPAEARAMQGREQELLTRFHQR